MSGRTSVTRSRERASGEWIVGSRPAPFEVLEPTRFRPPIVVVMDAVSGLLLGVEPLAHGSGLAEAARAIRKVMQAHSRTSGPGAGPRILRVDDPELANALRSRVSSSVAILVAPTPEIDAVVEHMADHVDLGNDRYSDLEHGRIAPEVVGRFFEAAATVYRLAPWRIVQSDCQLLRLDAPLFGVDAACVSIIGGLGENYGVLIFDSIDDFSDMARGGGQAKDSAGPAGVPILSINFDGRKALPRGLAREVKRHGWPVAGPRAYPWLLPVDADGRSRALTERDWVYATAVLDALAVFFREHADVFEDEPESPVSRTVVVDGLPGVPSVTLTAPHPEADWDWLEGGPLEAARWDEADDLSDQFVADQVRAGRSAEWLRGAQEALDDLFRFRIDTAGEAAVGWTAKQIDEYLLDYFPALGAIPSEDVESVPEYLDAFFAWLGDAGYESLTIMREVRERMTRKRATFLERARDPAPGSPRSLGQEIRKSGIDTSDEAALAAFISEWAAELEKESTAPPARRRRRWEWTPGSPAPEPDAPCPCGSGARYRKCCMPR
jgi:hypothetical protein